MSNNDEQLTKDQMLERYEVHGFMFCLVDVTRKSDGVRGTLSFTEDLTTGRRYSGFVPGVNA